MIQGVVADPLDLVLAFRRRADVPDSEIGPARSSSGAHAVRFECVPLFDRHFRLSLQGAATSRVGEEVAMTS